MGVGQRKLTGPSQGRRNDPITGPAAQAPHWNVELQDLVVRSDKRAFSEADPLHNGLHGSGPQEIGSGAHLLGPPLIPLPDHTRPLHSEALVTTSSNMVLDLNYVAKDLDPTQLDPIVTQAHQDTNSVAAIRPGPVPSAGHILEQAAFVNELEATQVTVHPFDLELPSSVGNPTSSSGIANDVFFIDAPIDQLLSRKVGMSSHSALGESFRGGKKQSGTWKRAPGGSPQEYSLCACARSRQNSQLSSER